MNLRTLNNEQGFASIIAIIMVAMLTLIGLAALSTSDSEQSITLNELQEMKAFYAAEGGLEKAASILQQEFDSTGAPPTTMFAGSESLNFCTVAYDSKDDGPPTQKLLTNGTLAGLHALVKTFSLSSTAQQNDDNATVQLSQSFEAALVPIFQFAVFYDNDLEIAPGPAMTLGGRVHTNGNLYLQAGSSLRIDSYVTADGNIYHGRKGAGGVSSGDVLIKDASGTYQSMKDGSGWLDSDDANWYDSSVARWNGRVQDEGHGQGPLSVPLNGSAAGDAHKLIEREAGNPDSYESKSTLKFIDRKAMVKVGGIWIDRTADLTATGVISFADNKFFDAREGAWVDVMELDVQQLYNNGFDPTNGVIYYSDQTTDFPALRLNNAAELGAGLTIAAENPIYTNGDYNSVNKQPSSLLADAVTFLSNSWDDALSSGSKNNRIAVNTVVNASYLTGNTETTSSNYNGGFENLPRFLEKWSGKNFTWRGSAVNLWNSRQANGDWSGAYYSPPIRDWLYDPDLDDPANMPPESPAVRVFQRTGWKMEDVGYTAR